TSEMFRLVTAGSANASIRVPVFGDHAVLHAEHIEPEGLVVLAVRPGPCLSHVSRNRVLMPSVSVHRCVLHQLPVVQNTVGEELTAGFEIEAHLYPTRIGSL